MVSFLLKWPQSKWQRQTMRNQFVSVMSVSFRFFPSYDSRFLLNLFPYQCVYGENDRLSQKWSNEPSFRWICLLACLLSLFASFSLFHCSKCFRNCFSNASRPTPLDSCLVFIYIFLPLYFVHIMMSVNSQYSMWSFKFTLHRRSAVPLG